MLIYDETVESWQEQASQGVVLRERIMVAGVEAW